MEQENSECHVQWILCIPDITLHLELTVDIKWVYLKHTSITKSHDTKTSGNKYIYSAKRACVVTDAHFSG